MTNTWTPVRTPEGQREWHEGHSSHTFGPWEAVPLFGSVTGQIGYRSRCECGAEMCVYAGGSGEFDQRLHAPCPVAYDRVDADLAAARERIGTAEARVEVYRFLSAGWKRLARERDPMIGTIRKALAGLPGPPRQDDDGDWYFDGYHFGHDWPSANEAHVAALQARVASIRQRWIETEHSWKAAEAECQVVRAKQVEDAARARDAEGREAAYRQAIDAALHELEATMHYAQLRCSLAIDILRKAAPPARPTREGSRES